MIPGATTRPSASIVRAAAAFTRPISRIRPSLTATSARQREKPVPSTTMPPLITRSYAMSVLAAPSARAVPDREPEAFLDHVRDAGEVLPRPLRPGRSVRRQRLPEDRHPLEVRTGQARGERDVLVHELDGERGVEVTLDDTHGATVE